MSNNIPLLKGIHRKQQHELHHRIETNETDRTSRQRRCHVTELNSDLPQRKPHLLQGLSRRHQALTQHNLHDSAASEKRADRMERLVAQLDRSNELRRVESNHSNQAPIAS